MHPYENTQYKKFITMKCAAEIIDVFRNVIQSISRNSKHETNININKEPIGQYLTKSNDQQTSPLKSCDSDIRGTTDFAFKGNK